MELTSKSSTLFTMSYPITLKPVYSCPAEDVPNSLNLPENWRLSWHQLETWKAINDPTIDVIFNTAMTGDGKSLAAYLETLQKDFSVMGLYPTNELARDQFNQIQGYIEQFKPSHEPRICYLSGAELELYAEEENISRQAAISTLAESDILLTNPDIFHYLHRGAYLTPYDNPDKLWNKIDKKFNIFIFDEFHVFSAPQVASVLNTMLLIRRTNCNKRYLFLSATPSHQLLDKLDKAGFKYKCIDPVKENKYQFPNNVHESEQLQSQNWRQISQKINLSFTPLESTYQASEKWLKENKTKILQYFQDHSNSKGAIILNSIASVKRLVPIFRELFEPLGLTVGENTGLSGSQEKARSLSSDLVLGTSTIDVGVDFKINFLVFESSDTGNFIQRLGRLGRHDSYEKDGQFMRFNNFMAIALVPNFLVERLFAKNPAPLEINGQYERHYFNSTLEENYRKINNFDGYYRRWGAIQSFKLWRNLRNPRLSYGNSVDKFKADCELVFERNLGKVAGQINYWLKEWRILSHKDKAKNSPIEMDASSFRGSSPLQCGLYDLTEEYEGDRFKTYDLPGILSNLDIEMWTEAGFMRSLNQTSERLGQPIPKGRFKHCLGFMKLRDYREERLNWRFTYTGLLQPIADAWKVQVLVGVKIWQPDNQWISGINRQLSQIGLVCYVICRPVAEVRQKLQLPMHFALYPINDETCIHETTPPYSIAIGQSALLLDTLAYRLKSGGESWIC